MPSGYKEDADNFRNMTVRPDDVWLATFPRRETMGDKIKVHQLDPQTQEKLSSLFLGGWEYFQFGDIRCTMPSGYKEDADNFRNMVVRPDDVWVATFPRCGTTWTQELVWMVMNNFDYDTASKIPLMGRYIFLEANNVINLSIAGPADMDSVLQSEIREAMPRYEEIVKAPSPRFFKTHMPFSLLPENLLATTKVVYVARDPRDVAVSFYHHNRIFFNYSGDFKTYWNLFIEGLITYAPFFPHLKEAWALRHHPNMLFMYYEDMISDLPSCIKRVADFFGKEPTNAQIMKLCEHLDIKNFRQNESVNPAWISTLGLPDTQGFVRKGKSGGWANYFDEEMAAQAQAWMRDNLAGTDLRFPEATK